MLGIVQVWLMTVLNLDPDPARFWARVILASGTLLAAVLADLLAQFVIQRVLQQLIKLTDTRWDDIVLKYRVFNRLARLAPAAMVYFMAPQILFERGGEYDFLILITRRAVELYVVVLFLMVIDAFLNAVEEIYNSFETSREAPIRSFVQGIKIVIYGIGLIILISVALDESPLLLLSGLGALSAVLLLVFRDSILGFVAGIQLTANRMVAKGDWIEMPHYAANGEVLEVALTTVKVQNWDKTITTIPTYALISESFKNWRGMAESGGRRISRDIYIDVTSIRFLDDALIDRLNRIQLLQNYLADKLQDVAEHNAAIGADPSSPANGRNLTNIGTFRAYMLEYLRAHPKVHQEMTMLVRQLDPTDHGLPINIYCFSNDQAWASFEAIQADIFDHIYAVLPEFGLRAYQRPIGYDIQQAGTAPGRPPTARDIVTH